MRYICTKEFNSEHTLNGYTCITEIEELHRAIVDRNATEISFEDSFVDTFYTPSSFEELVNEISKINPSLQLKFETPERIIMPAQVKRLTKIDTADELFLMLNNQPDKVLDIIKFLGRKYLEVNEETLIANSKLASMQLKVSSLTKQVRENEDQIDRLVKTELNSSTRLEVLVNRINNKYNGNINPDEMFDVEGNSFDKVLYLKEITRLRFTDTLIYYLQEILRSLYSMKCRLVVMEPFNAHDKYVEYPNLVPTWSCSKLDIVSSDIFMAGIQSLTMSDILKNASNIKYLIILDRTGDTKVHVTGSNVEPLYMLSSYEDKKLYSQIPEDRIISYNADSLNIPYIPEFDEMPSEKKMGVYSSLPITKTLIEMLERTVRVDETRDN